MAGTTRSDRHIKRPRCNHRQQYKLADGRRKCKRCGKKFTPRRKRRGVGAKQIKEISRLFWLGVPAVRAAEDPGLHRNTTYRYYKRLRERIAAESPEPNTMAVHRLRPNLLIRNSTAASGSNTRPSSKVNAGIVSLFQPVD